MSGRAPLVQRAGEALGSFFDVDSDWVRPDPGRDGMRTDAWIALAFFVFGVVGLELTRSMGAVPDAKHELWVQWTVLALGTLPLLWRRRYPIVVMLLLQVHLFAAGEWLSAVAYQFTMQIVYFFALFSGVAWSRDRRALIYAVGGVLVLMGGWFTWTFALGNAYDAIMAEPQKPDEGGLVGRFAAVVVYQFLINVAYFGGALLWGRSAWRSACQVATLTGQAETIAAQSAELRDQAVVAERLRIARELHDVVAHHVSVMGVQAAAARRVLTRDPDAAAEALASVEESSRSAVGEMRALLGTLRDSAGSGAAPYGVAGGPSDRAEPAAGHRAPDPGLREVAELVESAQRPGFVTTYQLVEDQDGAAAQVPGPLSLSTYRIVQEALSNTRKHSSATRASVVVRVDSQRDRYIEAEVVDDGRPLGATSGTGLGQLGMRERVASHGGQLDVGPRLMGGYRVRVRFPLQRAVGVPVAAARGEGAAG